MIDCRTIEEQLAGILGLARRPIGVAFCDVPPAGVAKFIGTAPSGCSFWKLAADGRTFYTTASDHYDCSIGSYTHNIDLPLDRAGELPGTLSLMAEVGYIKMEEVPAIPRLSATPKVVVYAPLADMPVDPDVVLFAGSPGRLMLLQEAAIRAGVSSQMPLFGRPTCMALPVALQSGVTASTGCVGNRVYTEVGDDDLYVAVPGTDLHRVAAQVQTIADANAKLLAYHQERRVALTAL